MVIVPVCDTVGLAGVIENSFSFSVSVPPLDAAADPPELAADPLELADDPPDEEELLDEPQPAMSAAIDSGTRIPKRFIG
jgi:hypothetical protein